MARIARRSPLALVAAAATFAFAAAAHAQTPARTGASADAGVTVRTQAGTSSAPGSFHGPSTTTAANVGGGATATTANAPTTELRGAGGPAPDVITGPIGPGDAARLIRAQMPRLRPCYERARATRPTLAGRVEVRFTIGRDGRVTTATATGMPAAPEVATCVADALRQTTFPQPEGGSLQFVYPLMFVPEPAAAPPARGRGRAPATRTPAARSR